MKTKLIFKGLLLYVTILLSAIWLCSINVTTSWLFLSYTMIVGILIYLCYKYISLKEFYILSLYKWFNNLIEK